LACSPFAHHYSGNRGCFLFLWVLRCFTSPRFLLLPYVFRQGRWAITPNQVSLFGNPRIEVWLPTPRGLSQAPTSFIGSWCQGIHRVPLLTWQLQMMLASTVQFSRYGRSRSPGRLADGGETGPVRLAAKRPFPQDPTACSARASPRSGVPCRGVLRHCGRTNLPRLMPEPNNQCSTNERPPQNVLLRWLWTRHRRTSRRPRQLLLRKEVIQPHLPVRLPCYDFVPIAGPTFDGSLPYGLGHRLRVLPTFVT
jgi:hypothetical protein